MLNIVIVIFILAHIVINEYIHISSVIELFDYTVRFGVRTLKKRAFNYGNIGAHCAYSCIRIPAASVFHIRCIYLFHIGKRIISQIIAVSREEFEILVCKLPRLFKDKYLYLKLCGKVYFTVAVAERIKIKVKLGGTRYLYLRYRNTDARRYGYARCYLK